MAQRGSGSSNTALTTKTLYGIVIIFAFIIGITNFINSFIMNPVIPEDPLVLNQLQALDKISRLENEINLLNHKNKQLVGNKLDQNSYNQEKNNNNPPLIVKKEIHDLPYDRQHER